MSGNRWSRTAGDRDEAGAGTTRGRIALGTTIIGLSAFVLLATWLVPWGPVPGGAPDPVPADSVFSADQVQRAEDYARWARTWSWSSLAVSLAVACWLGFSQRGRRLTDRIPGKWWVRVVLVVGALEVIGRLATLPFAIAYRRLQLDAGLSTSSWPAWAFDLVKGEVVDVVITSLAVLALVGIARRWPRAWPAIAGGVLALFVVAGSFAYPLVVEPLFNSFTPLEEGPLRTQILELADKEDVEVDEVLVADASRRTTTLNAYVSGFGGTRRVVVYDTLVEDLSDQQALSVVAHELAHARNDDVLVGTSLGAAGALLGVGLLGLLAGVAQRRGRPGVGEVGCGADDPRARGSRRGAREPGPERDQPADRDPGRRGRTEGDERPPAIRRPAAPARHQVIGRPDPARVVAVVVRLTSDGPRADRDRAARKRRRS